MGTIGLPWWNIGGNHDLNFEAPDRRYSRETFKRVFGPNYYAFFYAKTLFLMLDDVELSRPRPGRSRGRRASTRAGSTRGSSSSCATCSRIRRDDTLDRRRDAHPDPHLSRRRALSEPAEPGGVLRPVRRAPLHRQLRRPHPHDRASLFRRRRRLEGRDAPPPARPDDAVGLVVERASRSSRRAFGRQPRRHAERLPHPLGRRQRLYDPLRSGEGAERPADAALDRQPLPRDQQGRRPRLPPGAAPGLAGPARRARRFDADRQRVRRRRQDQGQDGHRRPARRSR